MTDISSKVIEDFKDFLKELRNFRIWLNTYQIEGLMINYLGDDTESGFAILPVIKEGVSPYPLSYRIELTSFESNEYELHYQHFIPSKPDRVRWDFKKGDQEKRLIIFDAQEYDKRNPFISLEDIRNYQEFWTIQYYEQII